MEQELQEELNMDALAIGSDGDDGVDSLLEEQSGVFGPLEVGLDNALLARNQWQGLRDLREGTAELVF
jgi:hypothetical protein